MTSSTQSQDNPFRRTVSLGFQTALLIGMVCAAVAAVGVSPRAHAHQNATGVVKERMDLMKEMGVRTKAIGRMLKGKTSLDPEFVREAAIFIGAASSSFRDMFPPGSDQKPTETLPAVWSEWPRFESSLDELSETAAELEEAAKDADEEAILRGFVNVAKACKSCHERFREK